jgi:SAM-dependent methyltransferase
LSASNRKDHFSKQAGVYAKYRPLYPDELFRYLASLTTERKLAWDCATGNGQAALGLVKHFDRVIATDFSASQINGAFSHPRISYKIASADDSGLPSHTVDLITVAQAFHWFNLDTFYPEAKRALKAGGVIAVWCHSMMVIDPIIDPIISRFHDDIPGPFWPPERKLVIEGFRSLPFPFREISSRRITIQTRWSVEMLLGYFRSWSATQRCIDATGKSPISEIESEIKSLRHADDHRLIHWPISLRVGICD